MKIDCRQTEILIQKFGVIVHGTIGFAALLAAYYNRERGNPLRSLIYIGVTLLEAQAVSQHLQELVCTNRDGGP